MLTGPTRQGVIGKVVDVFKSSPMPAFGLLPHGTELAGAQDASGMPIPTPGEQAPGQGVLCLKLSCLVA